ncbi:MAG: SH3 domain-containing protein [Myxococcales bacterium]|nr:SH3 domain-containing protein [Myxococcales bacterium]
MRIKTLLIMAIAGLLMVLVAPLASAERVKTTRTTKVMKRPGEQSAVVTRVKSGRTLTVIAKQGRWMKVRVNGRTGWVARSTVQTVSAREVPRNTRRRPFVDGRSTRRGWGGDAPDDRVGGDATDDSDDEEEVVRPKKSKKKKTAKKAKRVRDDDDDEDFDDDDGDDDDLDDEDAEEEPAEPQERVVMVAVAKTKLYAKPKKGKSNAKVKKGRRLVVIEEKDGWMLVEDPEEGDSGWIKADDVYEQGARKFRTFSMDGRLGFVRMGQVFRSTGTGALANYDLQAAAASLTVRGAMVQKYGKQYLIGGELAYTGGKSAPGIRYSDGANAVDIPFTSHDIDLHAIAGYDMKNKMGGVAWAHVGYHYGMFQVANVGDFTANLARLPSENLTGPTVGAGFEAPRLSEKVGARASADYLIMGKRTQTQGLEDGAVSTVKALWGGVVLSYQWKKDMTLDAGYAYTWSKTEWSGVAAGSMRGHAADSAARKDTDHALTVGVAKTF